MKSHAHFSDGDWQLRNYPRGVKRYVSHCVTCRVAISRETKPVNSKRLAASAGSQQPKAQETLF